MTPHIAAMTSNAISNPRQFFTSDPTKSCYTHFTTHPTNYFDKYHPINTAFSCCKFERFQCSKCHFAHYASSGMFSTQLAT